MKKISIIVCIFVAIMIAFCGCSNNLSFEVAVLDNKIKQDKEWNEKQIIRSISELESLNITYNISEYTNKYDEDYFRGKSIIVLLFTYPYLGADLHVDSMRKDGEVIQIGIIEKQKKEATYLTVMSVWTCIIEIDSENIRDISGIEFEISKK